jgi:hypothetical protein
MRCTTRSAVRIFWHTPARSVARTRAHRGRRSGLRTPTMRRDAYCILPTSPATLSAGHILTAQRPQSRSTPASNRDSARCPASTKLPGASCLGAFWTPVSSANGGFLHRRRPKACKDADIQRMKEAAA